MNFFFFLLLPIGFYLDYSCWKRLTPCIVSFIGVYFILLIYELVGEQLGFIALNDFVYFYISIFYLCGFLASIIAAVIFARIEKISPPVEKFHLFDYGSRAKRLITSITILICIVCSYHILTAYYELGSFVSEDFEGKLTYGFAGHSFAILMATVPFLVEIFLREKKKRYLLLILFVFSLLFLKQVKYWVMIPLVWMVWYIISGRYIELSIKKYFTISLQLFISLFILFFSVYFMKVIMSNQGSLDYTAVLFSIMIHFLGYLFSGILTLSNYEMLGLYNNLSFNDGLGLLAGFLNLFNVILGNDLLNLELVRPMLSLNLIYNSVGNVPSLWGTMLLAAGNYAFIFFFMMIFILSILCGMAKHSKLSLIIYTFLTSFLFFSWFDYYYYLLTPYEVSAYVVILYAMVRLFKNRRPIISKSEGIVNDAE